MELCIKHVHVVQIVDKFSSSFTFLFSRSLDMTLLMDITSMVICMADICHLTFCLQQANLELCISYLEHIYIRKRRLIVGNMAGRTMANITTIHFPLWHNRNWKTFAFAYLWHSVIFVLQVFIHHVISVFFVQFCNNYNHLSWNAMFKPQDFLGLVKCRSVKYHEC